jgi:hypothetical protein
MLKRNELKLDDIAIHFGDHVMMYGEKFDRLGDKQVQSRYAGFLSLEEKIKASKRYRQFQNHLETYFDKEFWECEASLRGRS